MTLPSPTIASSSMTSTNGQARLVIVGATGMVGGYALRHALHCTEVRSVTSIVQRNAKKVDWEVELALVIGKGATYSLANKPSHTSLASPCTTIIQSAASSWNAVDRG